MDAGLKDAKRALRRALRARPVADARGQSAAIAARVLGLPAVMAAGRLSVYIVMPGGAEADPAPILAAALARGAAVYAPRVTGPSPADMAMLRVPSFEAIRGFPASAWGIPEPPPGGGDALEEGGLDCVVLPGAGFDAGCRRIGHGKGYYDSFLARAAAAAAAAGRPPPFTVGLCLREQLVEGAVPVGPSDVALDAVVTPDATFMRRRDDA
jgi:5-formyltetrahydrofolate cyclo-ligase